MPRTWRVITVNFPNGRVIIEADDFKSRDAARRYILNRWGHVPPWAHVTSITDPAKLQHKFGFEGL